MLSARSMVLEHVIIGVSMGYVTVNIDKGYITRQIKKAMLWTAIADYNGGLPLQLKTDKFTVFKYDNVYGLICKGVKDNIADAAELLGENTIGIIFNGGKCYDECIEGEWKHTKL